LITACDPGERYWYLCRTFAECPECGYELVKELTRVRPFCRLRRVSFFLETLIMRQTRRLLVD
jgi:hypothetical protein